MHDVAEVRPAELERHRAFLQRLARELVRGEAAAEDLVQDAFVRALERPPASAAALRAWLAQVVRRLASNRARGEGRARERERAVARPERQPSEVEALASLEVQARVLDALRALGEPYRSTLWLRWHEGRGPGAIAALQGTTRKTVESRLARGLALLRAELDRRAGGDRTRWLGGVAALARIGNSLGPLALVGVAGMKKVALAVLVLLVAALGWRLASSRGAPAEAREEALALADPARASADPAPADARREAVPLAAAPERADPRASLRVLVRWDDGTPAPDVGLFVHPEDDPLAERHVVRARSDAHGVARVHGLHPGRVRVEADRGGECEGVAEVGDERELVLALPRGVDVEGTVSDRDGAPVAGAEIVLVAEKGDWLATRPVTRADAEGSYAVRDVSPTMLVGAQLGGRASLLEWLPQVTRDGRARADLVLDSPTCAVAGVVLDPERRPVAGALVAAGDAGGYWVRHERGDPYKRRAFGVPVVETDAEGRFSAAGVWQANFAMRVEVLAEGHPLAQRIVAQSLGTPSFVEILLEPACKLSGVVRDARGAPLDGATVTVLGRTGELEADAAFPRPRTRSGGEGGFRLELLPPGPASVRVDPPAGAAGAISVFELALAGDLDVDLALAEEAVLAGRVEDTTGRPLAGLRVDAQLLGGGHFSLETDSAGRFELQRASHPPYVLRVYDSARTREIARVEGASPGAEIVVRVEPHASVSGTFTDVGARSGAASRANAWLQGGEDRAYSARWAGERFAVDEVPPGTYRLWLRAGEELVHRSEAFTLAPGEHRDVGVLASAAPGTVRLDLAPSALVGAYVCSPDFEVVQFLEPLAGGGLGAELQPGEWVLRVEEEGRAEATVPFSIRSRETTRLELALEAGAARTLELALAPGARWSEIVVHVRGADGALRAGRHVARDREPPSVLVVLPPGRYDVEAETDTGLRGRGSFSVDALEPQREPLAFELR